MLSLVANPDGTWRLSRARRWPGLGNLSKELSLTPDGDFALCIVSANHGRDRHDLVSVVSLGQFKTVASVRTSALAEVTGSHRTYRLDRRGSLVVDASTPSPRHPGDDVSFGAVHRHKLATFELPHMRMIKNCEYSEWTRRGSVVRRENESNCADLLRNSALPPASVRISSRCKRARCWAPSRSPAIIRCNRAARRWKEETTCW